MVEALRWEVHHRDILVDALVHDIRTPLLAIRNSLSLVRFGAGSERIGMDITRETIAEVQSTLSLINDVALAHRLERSLVSAKREHIDLLVLANRVAERLRIASAGSGCSIDVWGTASSVIGDVTALDRALTNLLDNALRFAVHGARVEVFPGMLRIIDDGPGMDWSPGRSFAPYQYGPGNGSLGLGLYIASTILEAHGGRLLLETTGPEGTVLLAYIGAAKVP